MAKQLMIYNNIQPMNDAHKNWAVSIDNYAFTKDINSVPLLASEFVVASNEYPIVFTASADGFMVPLAIFGLYEDKNLLLDKDNRFTTNYLPAFVRRYPFILGGTAESDMMTLCIDEETDCVSKDGSKGLPLFEANGEQTEHMKGLVEFLKDYQVRAEQTKIFCNRLKELDLFEPMSAKISFNGKKPLNINLSGFSVIKPEKLKQLSDEVILEFFKNDALELIFAHIRSLNNFNHLIEILGKQLTEADAAETAEATA